MEFRLMNLEDYNEAMNLWHQIDGIGLRAYDDSLEGIERFLKRNPHTNFVCMNHNKMVGIIMAGHDGRRGYLYHVAVHPDFRSQGLGRKLVNHSLDALKKEGIYKVALVVFKKNTLGNDFWEKYGFEIREDLNYRNMTLILEEIE